ncbi:MAG TPA: chemotaxis response regulator protein-glutamate methylesterase [Longimicrobiales bacterium]|nr:chemotaxis response regulator protein-glutamate methylesterase [Longimicrobiales bacterium]
MVRVLVVDDSAVVRRLLAATLQREPDIEVITAVDPFDAREKVLRFAPDVITLDIEMPRMDGLSFLQRLMKHHPVPVIIVSSLTPRRSDIAVHALQLGALEVVAKPAGPAAVTDMAAQLLRAVRAAAAADVRHLARGHAQPAGHPSRARRGGVVSAQARDDAAAAVVAIGASTGGPVAIEQVLASFPDDGPGVLVVQHMPAGFTAAFARRLDSWCRLEVREARDGDLVRPGIALVAPGGRHMVLQRDAGGMVVAVRDGPQVHYQKPSVDVLFHSVAASAGADAVGVLLTGMGSDGASGLRAMRDAGAHTIAQDEATSVVFSMPGEAIRFGGACEVLPLPRIGAAAATAATPRPRRAGTPACRDS